MAERWALAVAEGGGVEVAPFGPEGLPTGPVRREPVLLRPSGPGREFAGWGVGFHRRDRVTPVRREVAGEA
ncbi:predicted protein [Streptomyces lividans TK24]|nr:predicted protein [Streptomyces lividans TK24]